MHSHTDTDVDIFGVTVNVTNYAAATENIMLAAMQRRSYAVTALATHGLMEAVRDPSLRHLVNSIDMVTPDGQPVRWAMNLLREVGLVERVYGPDLMRHVCTAAAEHDVPIYLFGSTQDTIDRLKRELTRRFPGLTIAGSQADRFREATTQEDAEDVERINTSGAGLVFVGRGCPRQERWVAEHRGSVNAAMLAVGAAFDYWAGTLPRPPAAMQRWGLEWVFRLKQEPKRLARRYAVNNTLFLLYLAGGLAKKLIRKTRHSALATLLS